MTVRDYKNGLVHIVDGGPYQYAHHLMYYFLCGGDCLTVPGDVQPETPTCLKCMSKELPRG